MNHFKKASLLFGVFLLFEAFQLSNFHRCHWLSEPVDTFNDLVFLDDDAVAARAVRRGHRTPSHFLLLFVLDGRSSLKPLEDLNDLLILFEHSR